MAKAKAKEELKEMAKAAFKAHDPAKDFSASTRRFYQPLSDLIHKTYAGKITEFEVYGPGVAAVCHVEDGRIEVPAAKAAFITQKWVTDLCHNLAANMAITFSAERLPILSARTPDGDRLQAMVGRNVESGVFMSIRVKRIKPVTFDDFEVSEEDREAIIQAVRDGRMIVISGGTGSGKTTFLNMICGYIPETDKILVAEDTREIVLRQKWVAYHIVSRTEGATDVTWKVINDHLVRSNPDVIIPGELSIANVSNVLAVMDTGHDSIMVTTHANTPPDAVAGFGRRVMLNGGDFNAARAAEEFLVETVALIIQIKHMRHGADGQRRVVTDVVRPKDVYREARAIETPSLSPQEETLVRGGAYNGGKVHTEASGG